MVCAPPLVLVLTCVHNRPCPQALGGLPPLPCIDAQPGQVYDLHAAHAHRWVSAQRSAAFRFRGQCQEDSPASPRPGCAQGRGAGLAGKVFWRA